MKKAYHFTVQIEVLLENDEDDIEFPGQLPDSVKSAVVCDINMIQEYADNTAIEHADVSDGVYIAKVHASLENDNEV